MRVAPNPSVQYFTAEVYPKGNALDPKGLSLTQRLRELTGHENIRIRTHKLYFFKYKAFISNPTGAESPVPLEYREVAALLLQDPVIEDLSVTSGLLGRVQAEAAVEVHPLPGVMDSAALTTLEAANRLLARRPGSAPLLEVRTAVRYGVEGIRQPDLLDRLGHEVLANRCIQRIFIQCGDRRDPLPAQFPEAPVHLFELRRVAIRDLDEAALAALSRRAHLFLSSDEMSAIQRHFIALGRDPTDLELETLAQTWSEHCVHKTLRAAVTYHGAAFGDSRQNGNELQEGGGRRDEEPIHVSFENLLKETIFEATRRLNHDWCLSVFRDNAGVIEFDAEYGIAFKVETHNHPSAIEPYGGAATGAGGCIRDILGCGLGAKPIAATDVFCLAPPDFPEKRIPESVLHPRRVLNGVVRGVGDYGNCMGIPTVNGAVYFDDRYLANPLVFCGCVGLIPRNRLEKGARPGDLIVLIGGRTGRDGIHGATFSSAEMEQTHADEFSHAVQIGNPIEEKKMLDAILAARNDEGECLYRAITDCGAGGLSSAVGEMGQEIGAEVDLEKVPLKYAGLKYDEIWISEAQERMVLAVPPENLDRFKAVMAAEQVEATVIGRFRENGRLIARFEGTIVGDLDMEFLHNGLPKRRLKARWSPPAGASYGTDPAQAEGKRPTCENLLAALGMLNVASKEWVIRQYDHEVQGRSVVKPLCGPGNGPSDAAVLRPRLDSRRAIAIGCGLWPEGSAMDPYWMAVEAVDEALRNVICVGGRWDRTAILDNFCWPKCDGEEALGALVRTCKGAMDAALAYGLPFISGKDSLNNQFVMKPEEARRLGLPERLAIPYTLLISAVSILEDADRAVTMDLKEPGNALVFASAPARAVGLNRAAALHAEVGSAIRSGKAAAAHDISDGGLLVAAAEMAIASGRGLSLHLEALAEDAILLDRVLPGYLLEMSPADARATAWPVIGKIGIAPILQVTMCDGGFECPVAELERAWKQPLSHL